MGLRTEKRHRIRSTIIENAIALFREQGFDRARVREIAARCDLSEATFFNYFPTKDAVLSAWAQGLIESAFEAASRDSERALRSMLRDACGLLAGEYATLPDDMQAELRRFFVSVEDWLAELLEEGRREGEFRFDGDAGTQAQALFAALQGALLAAAALRDPERFRTAAERLVAGVVR